MSIIPEKIRPIGDKILIRLAPEELGNQVKLESGLYLPDRAQKERYIFSEVLAVGPGRLLKDGTRTEMPFKPGDKVLHNYYAGHKISKNKDCCLFMLCAAEVQGVMK